MNQKLFLKDKTALVTGSSRGIGKAIAILLTEMGANVAINYVSNKDKAEDVVNQIKLLGRRAIAVQADVSKSNEVNEMVEAVSSDLGDIQILINNAAIGRMLSYENVTEEIWDETIDINLKSVFLVTQAVLPAMLKSSWGRIINISSVAANTGGLIGPHYTASKAGILGLTRYYAGRLAKSGITVNAISPALIETDMIKDIKINPDIIPVGRPGTVEESAMAVELLVQDSFITGQTINVNGGLYF